MNDKNRKTPEFIMKMSFVVVGFIVIIAIIIGSYIWNLIFDPNHFDVNKWGNRTVFNGSIGLGGMVLGYIGVCESLKASMVGDYNKLIESFDELIKELYDSMRIVYFDQFIPWLTQRQLREKKIHHLTKHGMGRMEAEAIVDYAREDDIEIISGVRENQKEKPTSKEGKDIVRKTRDGKEVLIPAIKGTWACYVEEVLTGKICVNVGEPAYYISDTGMKDIDLTSLERPIRTGKERTESLALSFVLKIIITAGYATLIGLLAADISSGIGTAEAVWNLIARISSLTLGVLGGAFTASAYVRFLCKELKEKMSVVRDYNKFLEAGEFTPKALTDTMNERIAAWHSEENNEVPADSDILAKSQGGQNNGD